MNLLHRFLRPLRAGGVVVFAVLAGIVATTTGQDAWSQSARTIKIIVPLPAAVYVMPLVLALMIPLSRRLRAKA